MEVTGHSQSPDRVTGHSQSPDRVTGHSQSPDRVIGHNHSVWNTNMKEVGHQHKRMKKAIGA